METVFLILGFVGVGYVAYGIGTAVGFLRGQETAYKVFQLIRDELSLEEKIAFDNALKSAHVKVKKGDYE